MRRQPRGRLQIVARTLGVRDVSSCRRRRLGSQSFHGAQRRENEQLCAIVAGSATAGLVGSGAGAVGTAAMDVEFCPDTPTSPPQAERPANNVAVPIKLRNSIRRMAANSLPFVEKHPTKSASAAPMTT